MLLRTPNVYVTAVSPLVRVSGKIDDDVADKIRDSFVLGRDRTFSHDPRFGLVVLNEIAARVLPHGVNDPGTAINVIQTEVRILSDWFALKDKADFEPKYDRLSMVSISRENVLDDAFRPIARGGAGNVEVCVNLFEALEAIQAVSPDAFDAPMRRFAEASMDRVREAMSHQADINVVEQAARRVNGRCDRAY